MQAYPFEIDWNAAYQDPSQPLVVDIGSGTSSASCFPQFHLNKFFLS